MSFPRILTAAIIALLPLFGFTQSAFVPGYIVEITGDTVRGEINRKEQIGNPDKIIFKDSSAKTRQFKATELKSFYDGRNVYEGGIIKVEYGAASLIQSYTAELSYVIDTVFLIKVVGGEKSLYHYALQNGRDQFYIRNGDEFELLNYKIYTKSGNQGNSFTAFNKMYLNQLSFYGRECNNNLNLLEDVQYTKKDLVQYFTRYYRCVGTPIEYKNEGDVTITEFGFLLGYTSTMPNFSSNDPRFSSLQFSNSSSFTPAFFMEIRSSNPARKTSVVTELMLSSYKCKETFENYTNESNYTKGTVNVSNSFLKLNAMARYHFRINNSAIFINAGLSAGIGISASNEYTISGKRNTIPVSSQGELFGQRNQEMAFLAGIGLKSSRYSFEMRFENPNSNSTSQGYKFVANRLHFLLGCRF